MPALPEGGGGGWPEDRTAKANRGALAVGLDGRARCAQALYCRAERCRVS